MTGLQSDRRIARPEPRLVEVVGLGRQRCFCLDLGLGNLAGRRLAARCGAELFLDWAFEAFDGEEWRRLLHSRTSPWPGGFYLGGDGAVVFQLWYPFASTRFRIRLLEPALSMHAHRCMHIRGLELYGTIMPPWRID